MEKLKSITIIFLLAVGLLASAAPAKPASVLLQEGLYAEEIEGDLDAAIKIYEQVIVEAKKVQRTAAHATYRIGMCYLKKGQKDKAAEYFQNIISDFPSQRAFARKAEKQLDKIKPRAERIVEQAVMTISTCAEGDPRVAKALESLKGLGENVVVNELVKFLNSETNTVRRSAIYVLWKGDLKDVSAAVPTLEKLCSHKEDITRGMTAIALGTSKIDSSFDVLCDMTLKDPSGYARRCAAYALGLMGNAEAKPILEKALKDSDLLVQNNAKAALTMLEHPAVGGFGPAERVPVEQLIKSGKVPAFKTQIYDNTGLDLETSVSVPFMDEWPTLCDVAWDNDGGGALMIKPRSSVRFLALGAAEKWEDAISMARNSLAVLRTSTARGMFASQSKFVAVLTCEGNLAVIQIGEYDTKKGTIYGWVEKIPVGVCCFGPVMERVINDDGEEKHCLIDFDTGRLFSHSTEIRSEEAFLRWIAENRIDAMGETRTSGPGLYGFDMAVIPIAAETWGTISPKGLADDLSIAKGGIPALMSAVGNLPVTYIFKTREGGMGVVQILEMQDNKKPRHFRIRYKMLQKPDVRGLSISPHRKLLDERTLIAINNQDRFGAKWFKVEREYEAASQSKKQQMIEKWMADAQKPDVTIRSSAIASLGNIACKQAADVLMKIAKEPLEFSRSNRPRWIAVRSLGRVGDMRAVPVLIDLLDHYNKDTQLYARVSLCEITGVYFGSDKTKWRKWWQQKGKSTVELDLSTPEATIKSFVKAVYDGNLEAAGACVSKDGADYDEFKEMLATESNHPFQAMIKAMDVSIPVEITSKSIKDGRCKISWHFMLGRVYYFLETKIKKGTHQEFSSYLELVGDKWLIRDI